MMPPKRSFSRWRGPVAVDEEARGIGMAFDHDLALRDVRARMRELAMHSSAPLLLLPLEFGLEQARAAYEVALEEQLDPDKFEQWLLKQGWLELVEKPKGRVGSAPGQGIALRHARADVGASHGQSGALRQVSDPALSDRVVASSPRAGGHAQTWVRTASVCTRTCRACERLCGRAAGLHWQRQPQHLRRARFLRAARGWDRGARRGGRL